MKIKPVQNFGHSSGKIFCIGQVYEVADKSAQEFVKAGIAVIFNDAPAPEKKAVKPKKVAE